MKTKDFNFELPPELIAQYPLEHRSDSRLLRYTRANKSIQHLQFTSLVEQLNPGDLLVMNNTKVMPARLYGKKSTGGQVELLVERVRSSQQFLAHIKASKAPKPGTQIILNDDHQFKITVLEKQGAIYLCALTGNLSVEAMLDAIGHIPLPPYITRADETPDFERYQTVYAKHKGSVAAPTAGLHFDDTILEQLKNKGVNLADITLHVGAGTFQPVRVDALENHHMHTEFFEINQALCDAVAQTKASGGRVIAVGTTSLRALESAAKQTAGPLTPQAMETNIFIYPGFEFKICDGLITNFHLPESTLLMLVSAFIGHSETMALYEEAIAKRYRFFSYGDATLLL